MQINSKWRQKINTIVCAFQKCYNNTILEFADLENEALFAYWVASQKVKPQYEERAQNAFIRKHIVYALSRMVKDNKRKELPMHLIEDNIPIESHGDVETRDEIEAAFSHVSQFEQRLLIDKFIYNITYRELGRKHNISHSAIRNQILAAIRSIKIGLTTYRRV